MNHLSQEVLWISTYYHIQLGSETLFAWLEVVETNKKKKQLYIIILSNVCSVIRRTWLWIVCLFPHISYDIAVIYLFKYVHFPKILPTWADKWSETLWRARNPPSQQIPKHSTDSYRGDFSLMVLLPWRSDSGVRGLFLVTPDHE